MGHKKKLLCTSCGQTLNIDSTQAGSTLNCACGKPIQVPTLREIAQLPDADAAERTRTHSLRRWTRTQGILFAIGAVCLLLSAVTATLLFANLPSLQLTGRAGKVAALDQQLDRLSASETHELWLYYRSAPNTMISIAEKIGSLEKQRSRSIFAGLIIGVLGVTVGVVLIIFSLRGGQPTRMP
ncbi:MAG: hypothetical protein VX970_09865 [Planctomycetota bacterium]|nr:hypothetical protein [Planctomycetota bacterium]